MKSILKKNGLIIAGLVALLSWYNLESKAVNSTPTWYVDAPCFTQGSSGEFDEIAVKDPSIVYSGGKYHLFYTGVSTAKYWQMGYASATTIEGLKSASHTYLSKISEGYYCAPQVFYFEPQKKWYMVYNDGNYGAAYATTSNVVDPNSWDGPHSLGLSSPTGYDFWVICDDTYAYLFNTQDGDSRKILCRKTALANFPQGWSEPQVAVSDTFEGVCVYKSLADGKYYMLPEDYNDNRYYELWTADNLNGPWTQIAEKWASRRNIVFNAEQWTANVSHGELLRAGANQKMEINDINRVDFFIQGVAEGNYPDYIKIPWEIGVIRNYIPTNPTATSSMTPSPTQVGTPTPSVTVVPTPTPSTSSFYTVIYTQNDWGNGASVTLMIKNNGTSIIDGWEVAWKFSGNQKITNLWNGTFTQNGTSVKVTNLSYNRTIPAGGTVTLGFNLSYSGTNEKPTNFTLATPATQ